MKGQVCVDSAPKSLFSAHLPSSDTRPIPSRSYDLGSWPRLQVCKIGNPHAPSSLRVIPFCRRRIPVHRDGHTHVATCSHESDSLLLAISDVLVSRGIKRASFPPPSAPAGEL
jgi:hypothetical protein